MKKAIDPNDISTNNCYQCNIFVLLTNMIYNIIILKKGEYNDTNKFSS